MAKIKKIGVLSLAKLHTIIGCFIGLILGILYSFGGLLIDILVTIEWLTSRETPGLSRGTLLAFGALIGMPIIFAAIGFIVGTIGAILFNLFAKRFGGIEIDFK